MIMSMSELIERTVTFGCPVNEGHRSYGLVRFVIEPPITAHNPKFLETAVMATPGNRYACGDFDLTHNVDVNFSDENGTHGSMTVHRGVKPDVFQDVVTTAFKSELELGSTALHFIFPEEP